MSSIWSGVRWLRGVITGGIYQVITFAADVVVNGKITIGGKVTAPEIAVTGDAAISGNVGVTGALNVSNGLDVNGPYFDASDVTQGFMPPTTFYGAVTFGSAGRVAPKFLKLAATVGMTASPKSANYIQYTTAAAGSTVTIDSTDAVAGDWIEFTNNSATNTVTINGGTIGILKNAVGFRRTITAMYDGSAWFVLREIGAM